MKQTDKKVMHSLSAKTTVNIILITLILGIAAVWFSFFTYKQSLQNQLIHTATTLGEAIAAQVEPESIDRYLESGETDDAYWATREAMLKIVNNTDIKYAVVTKPTEEGFYYLYDTDQTEEAWLLGDFQEYYPGDFLDNKANFLAGNEIPAIISNYEFGWLLSVLVPIRDASGVARGYVDVDLPMDDILSMQNAFLYRIILLLAGISVLLTAVSIVFARRTLVKPINKLAKATGSFVQDRQLEDNASRSIMTDAELETGDEVENLYHSIRKMEQDIYDYIDNLQIVTAEKERIGAELSVATQIQSSMLPCIFPPFPSRKEFELYATMTPAKEVGGDFYDFFLVDDDHLALIIADVSGKGVPAALFMAISKVLLQNCAQTNLPPQEVLNQVNNQLCINNEAEMFVTVWIGILQISTGKMACSNAGHEFPALRRADGSFELVKDKHGFVLAGMEGSRYLPYEIQLQPGDVLFVYTDGVPEATDASNQLFGTDRMLQALNTHPGADPATLLPDVKQAIDTFVGKAPQFDDITMLSLRYNGNPQAE